MTRHISCGTSDGGRPDPAPEPAGRPGERAPSRWAEGLSDEEGQLLLLRFSAGDLRALDQLIAGFSRMVYAVFLRWYRLSVEDADDLFQEVLLQLTLNATVIRNVRPWLLGTAINQARKQVRRLIRDRRIAERCEEETDLLTDYDGDDRRDLVGRALARSRPGDRQILSLVYLEGLSYQEAARRLHRPIGSIGPMRCRALARFKRVLVDLEPAASLWEAAPNVPPTA